MCRRIYLFVFDLLLNGHQADSTITSVIISYMGDGEGTMKKLMRSLLLTAVVSTSVFAAAAQAGTFTPGEYQGTGNGRNGSIEVEVTLSEDRIESVEIVSHSESEGISDPAIEKIPAAIVEEQSLAVDAITGASLTSAGILEAVTDAIAKSGADTEALMQKKEAEAGETIEKTADVIIVGAGGAGVSAATAVASEGKTAIVIEKTASAGGNTLASGGVWNAADPEMDAITPSEEGRITILKSYLEYDDSDFQEEYVEAYHTLKDQINEYLAGDTSMLFDSTEFHLIQSYLGTIREDLDGNMIYPNYDLISNLVYSSLDTMKWLSETTGSEFNDKVIIEPNGALWKRAHIEKNSKWEDLFGRPIAYAEENGVEFVYDCTADQLIVEDGAVTGVHATLKDGTEVILHANNGVVLSTGGFGANFDMVREYDNYWGDILDKVNSTTNVSAAQGEGILMAQEAVDAATTGMGFIQMNPIGFASNGALAQGNGGNVFYVNENCERFVNEYAERDVVSRAALENCADGGLFYEIGLKSQMEPSLALWQDADCYEAATIEELAELVGLDPEALAAQTEKYNSYVEAGEDPEFGKSIFYCKIETEGDDTYVCRTLRPAIHHTMGGLVIDTECHVYNTNDEVIKGLYAAGEVTGGIHAGNRIGGNAIADAYTYGRIAGTSAANAQ